MLSGICIFCAIAAFKFHEYVGGPGGVPAVCALIADYLLASTIALWVQSDAQERRRPLPYDFASFVFLVWPIAAPIYLVRTRGWRGLGAIGSFLLLWLFAVLFAFLLGYPRSLQTFAR